MVGKKIVMVCVGVKYHPSICWEGLRKVLISLSGWPSCEPKIRPWTSKLQNRRVSHRTTLVGLSVNVLKGGNGKNIRIVNDSCKDCVVLNSMNENRMKWV
jgi:hypothetical protein